MRLPDNLAATLRLLVVSLKSGFHRVGRIAENRAEILIFLFDDEGQPRLRQLHHNLGFKVFGRTV